LVAEDPEDWEGEDDEALGVGVPLGAGVVLGAGVDCGADARATIGEAAAVFRLEVEVW
jgi:hypothetical protein